LRELDSFYRFNRLPASVLWKSVRDGQPEQRFTAGNALAANNSNAHFCYLSIARQEATANARVISMVPTVSESVTQNSFADVG